MYMSAHLLASFSRPECANNRHRRCILSLRSPIARVELRIDFGRDGLVVVYAVEPESECFHQDRSSAARSGKNTC